MKKLFIIITFVLSSFFLLFSNVNATTHKININSSYYDILLDPDFPSFFKDVSSRNSYYFIKIHPNSYSFYTSDNLFTFSCSPSGPGFFCNSGLTNKLFYKFDYPGFSIKYGGNANVSSYHYYSNTQYILATNVDLIANSSDTYIISDGTYSLTIDGSSVNNTIPDVLDFYTMFYGSPISPPEPEDNYPILTSFYTTFIDRLGYVADYFSTHYLFLSIFVIFIFMFSLLLLRRFKR